MAAPVRSYDVEMNATDAARSAHETALRTIGDGDLRVGVTIKTKLEDIFARASEAEELYNELGRFEGVARSLNIDVNQGAQEIDIVQRRDTFGPNTLPEEDPITFLEILKDAWSDHMILILAAAAVVSLIIGFTVPDHGEEKVDFSTCWIEGFAILFSITLVTTIASVNDYKKELKFRELTEANNKLDITVLRNGVVKVIDVSELVVGDVANINPGLVMPVDGLFIKGLSVVIDESSVTGENDPKTKSADHPFFLTGTVVMTAESAWVLVCAVGENSFGGKLLMESRGDGTVPDTPLQSRLNELAEQIGKFGMAVAVLLFVILGIMESVRFARDDPNADAANYLEYFILSVAIVCVAVPEGLPLAVTISLAYSQNRMQQDNNQVRRLKACETMGNATTICSDKTGTLTQNLMSVVQGQISGVHFQLEKPGDFMEKINISNVDESCIDLLCTAISVNSSSMKVVRDRNKDGSPMPRRWIWDLDKGNKTDNALLDLVDRLRLSPSDVSNLQSLPHQRIRQEKLVDGLYTVFPFTSVTKDMATIIKKPTGGSIVYLKGGAEEVLAKCSKFRNQSGNDEDLNGPTREAIMNTIKIFAKQANRNIGIAYKNLDGTDLPTEKPADGYVWFGMLGIQDPLRPEVKEAVAKCQHAGVVVRMCTGDNIDTAIAISKECGIYKQGDLALTGKDFRDLVYDAFAMGDSGAARLTPLLFALTVLARSQPLDKQMLVLMHMTRGEVVAVTGDGTNDAPALRLANVGFVMKSGTDIAVKSADIVLLDDNFRSVQRAVVWGRTVNDNIRKFLQLQLSVNVVCVALTFISSVSSATSQSALTTVQLLWVNLIMDTFAALALATEAPSEECLSRGPIHRKAPLISRRMILGIGLQSIYQLSATLLIQHFGSSWFDVKSDSIEHRTLIFNVFVFCTIFNMFNARKLYTEVNVFEGFDRSTTFLVIIAITVVTQIFAVELFRDFVNTRPLNLNQWFATILIALPVFPIGVGSRFIHVSEPTFSNEFDPSEIDEDAKVMFDQLNKQVQTVISSHTPEQVANHGKPLVAAERILAESRSMTPIEIPNAIVASATLKENLLSKHVVEELRDKV